MMKDNILGISSVVENMSDYASFDEEETDDSDINLWTSLSICWKSVPGCTKSKET